MVRGKCSGLVLVPRAVGKHEAVVGDVVFYLVLFEGPDDHLLLHLPTLVDCNTQPVTWGLFPESKGSEGHGQ